MRPLHNARVPEQSHILLIALVRHEPLQVIDTAQFVQVALVAAPVANGES
jgi:hypothetical protein